MLHFISITIFFSVEHLLKVILKELLKEVEEALIEKQENIDKIALQTQLCELYKVFYQGVEKPLQIFKVICFNNAVCGTYLSFLERNTKIFTDSRKCYSSRN